ncbi:helix-turn-helix transcriptional regulator [Streptomyces sp. NPDC052535]|uniref:helix-turn-helix domain-containing protein n=1 Tax=Streptomyces sp. NPDC052535 TaxID=3155531 RepID=UPI00344A3685
MTNAFPWARAYDADQLAALMNDLAAAASGDNDLATLDAIEQVIVQHAPTPPRCPLTPRQIAILTGAASGETSESTARTLGISVHTVKAIKVDLCAQLQAHNITHAVAVAMHYGWLTDYQAPPPKPTRRRRGSVANRSSHAARASRLRRKPGVEAVIGDYSSRNTAYGTARSITTGELNAYAPAGDFEARAYLSRSRRWAVAARYVGTPTTPGRPAS